MDLVTCIRQYVAEMVRVAGPGMKVMLMDEATTSIVSCVYAQSEVMQKEVFLFERIDGGGRREPLKYLKCVCFVRATPDNLQRLSRELHSPRYAQYYIYFCNVISKSDVKTLAEADEHECVREMHEFYCDFVALLPHLFTLNLPNVYQSLSLSPSALTRCIHALAGVMLSLKKCATIRYEHCSPAARALAEGVRNMMNKESALFDMRRQQPTSSSDSPPILLLLDRRNDAVSPLLSQWTYQAMVHELLAITNNRVNLDEVPNIAADMKQVVLSPLHDQFYADNLYSNFGEIGQNCKTLMTDFQQRAKSNQKLESISDMKNFVESYPQFKKISGTVTKHVTVVSELSRLVGLYNLLDISETEQMLACHDEHSTSLQNVQRLLQSDRTSDLDATRLVMLYALHYEQHGSNDIASLMAALRRRGVPDRYVNAVNDMLLFGGSRARSADLFDSMSTAKGITKKFMKGLKGVENIYTQHTPYITTLLDELVRHRLKDATYPFMPLNAQHSQQLQAQQTQQPKIKDVIVFMIGGCTYEESQAVHQFNKTTPGVRVVLGGTAVHNARSFIDEVLHAAKGVMKTAQGGGGKKPLM